jgi:phenylpyruvate tautomerase PptA (4-oxalocrotonate tautomerase family)
MRNVKPEDLDELIEALSELEVDIVGSDGEVVKVSVE